MLKNPAYWDTEERIPLMVMNKGFADRSNLEPVMERALKWLSLFKEPLDVKLIEWPSPPAEPTRIIVKDVDRTFTGDIFREALTRVLTYLNDDFGDYHQGLSFMVSFLGLFLEESQVIAIARRLNSHKDFIPGYWKHEAASFVRDAYVLDWLLSIYNPEVHEHLAKNHIMPGTYPQKWFVALCVHVLPFDALFAFFDRFFVRGVRFLFQFGLGFFKVLGPSILKSDNPVTIFGYLRLDKTVVQFDDSTYISIVEAADTFEIPEIQEDEQLAAIRKRMYDTYLGAKYEAISARNAKQEQEEDSDLDWEEDGEAEPGAECEVCTNMAPDYWCFDCKKFVCQMCHDKSKEPHNKTHKMVSANNAPDEAYEPRTPAEQPKEEVSEEKEEKEEKKVMEVKEDREVQELEQSLTETKM